MSQTAKGQRWFFMAPSWHYVHSPAGQRDGQTFSARLAVRYCMEPKPDEAKVSETLARALT